MCSTCRVARKKKEKEIIKHAILLLVYLTPLLGVLKNNCSVSHLMLHALGWRI